MRPGEIQVVGYKDHLADISRLLDAQEKLLAYDEAKERELFEAYALEILGPYFMKPEDCLTRSGGTYMYGQPATAWCAWQSCAKSRARSAE